MRGLFGFGLLTDKHFQVFVMAAVVVACVHARNMGMQGDEGYGQMSQGFGSRGQRQAQRQGQDDQGRGGK